MATTRAPMRPPTTTSLFDSGLSTSVPCEPDTTTSKQHGKQRQPAKGNGEDAKSFASTNTKQAQTTGVGGQGQWGGGGGSSSARVPCYTQGRTTATKSTKGGGGRGKGSSCCVARGPFTAQRYKEGSLDAFTIHVQLTRQTSKSTHSR